MNSLFFSTMMPLAFIDAVRAFGMSDWLGRIVVVILLVMSVVAWSVMVSKFSELKGAERMTARFLQAFRREPHPLSMFLRAHEFPGSPIYAVYVAGCRAISGELGLTQSTTAELFASDAAAARASLGPLQMEVVRRAAERAVADQALALEERMGFLMSAISVSPLLGLFGTVWGVMVAFIGMASAGSANLAAMAPGIASALLTTVVGLVVAIPSTMGYNHSAARIRKLVVQTDNFSQEFVAEIQRTFGRVS